MKSPLFFTLLLTAGTLTAAETKYDTARIDAKVLESAPSDDERKLDRVGWARDIRGAIQLAAEHHRPVFLFTHDGRMGTGRC